MKEFPHPDSTRGVSPQEHVRFDARVLETLIDRLQQIDREKLKNEDKSTLVTFLFRQENIGKILTEAVVEEGEEIPTIIEKLKVWKARREQEQRTVEPEVPEPEKVAVESNTSREQAMATQEEINELYRVNNEEADEDQRISEALAVLAVFAAEKEGNEKVEVARTKSGIVEILFEEDVQEAELLHQEILDIEGAKSRLAVYDQELAELMPKKTGLFGGLFQKTQTDDFSNPRKQELEGKKDRTEEELAFKIVEHEAREKRVNIRFQEKGRALELPLAVSGVDTFSGSWSELLEAIETQAKATQTSLEANYLARQKKIAALEQKRDEVTANK